MVVYHNISTCQHQPLENMSIMGYRKSEKIIFVGRRPTGWYILLIPCPLHPYFIQLMVWLYFLRGTIFLKRLWIMVKLFACGVIFSAKVWLIMVLRRAISLSVSNTFRYIKNHFPLYLLIKIPLPVVASIPENPGLSSGIIGHFP